MNILVISDTHIPLAAPGIPTAIVKEAKKSDLCLHAGDFIDYKVFKELSLIAKLYAVCGNMDDQKLKKELPAQRIFTIEGITIALTHGRGAPGKLMEYINIAFEKDFKKIDLFIFGHSHYPLNQVINGKIYFNPGSCTDKVFSPYRSYGKLNISDGKMERRLVKIE